MASVQQLVEPPPVALPGGSSARREALRRFASHRLAIVGIVVLLVIVLMALAAPLLAPDGPTELDVTAINQPPGDGHLLGTDDVGRDVWARLVYGARTSLIVGLGSVSVALLIGTVLGVTAGFFGGLVDAAIMRFTDAVLSVPALLMVIVFVSIAGPSLPSVVIVIALTAWPAAARLVRGQVLSLREREFITAARVIGVPSHRIVTDHLLPNLLGPLSVVGTFGVASAILVEAGLSFLGLGVRPPTPSWGQMINAAQSPEVLLDRLWIWVPACVAIGLTVLAVNFIGDGLRDALDPRSER